MYIEYKNPTDKETAIRNIDAYVDKLNNLRFAGNFQIKEFDKSWTKDEMQFAFEIKSSILKRRTQGTIKCKDDLIIIEFEAPIIINNFITEENLRAVIEKHLGIALTQ